MMHHSIVKLVICFVFIIAFSGMMGMLYLCRIHTEPELVSAAVKMIQTDPSSAMAALQLLTVDGNKLAILSGLTGMAIGSLATMLANTNPRKSPDLITEGSSVTLSSEKTGTGPIS